MISKVRVRAFENRGLSVVAGSDGIRCHFGDSMEERFCQTSVWIDGFSEIGVKGGGNVVGIRRARGGRAKH
jgi:hypothetical protein